MNINFFAKIAPVAIIVSALAVAGSANATPLKVNIFSGFTKGGDGAPFSNPVGSFNANDIHFGTNWHPFSKKAFGADIFGSLSVTKSGTYSFTLTSDDGSGFFVHGNKIIDNGGEHSNRGKTGSVFLNAGKTNFEVQFYENGVGPSALDLATPNGVTYAPTVTPEPGATASFGFGIAGVAAMAMLAKRRKVSANLS